MAAKAAATKNANVEDERGTWFTGRYAFLDSPNRNEGILLAIEWDLWMPDEDKPRRKCFQVVEAFTS
jgi:hypothetical protein